MADNVQMLRPYKMLAFEPIVLFLSLLSGFADMLIFSFFESYGKTYHECDIGVKLTVRRVRIRSMGFLTSSNLAGFDTARCQLLCVLL
jgi:hypothetical protein